MSEQLLKKENKKLRQKIARLEALLASRHGKCLKNTAPVQRTDDLMAKFAKPAGSWKCGTCMTVNKSEASKCVVCETSKPGAEPVMPAFVSETSLNTLFKKPAGSWECTTCMVQNTAAALRCVACDSCNPGLQSAGRVCLCGGFTLSALQATTSGSSGFKFGNNTKRTSNNIITTSNGSMTSAPLAGGFKFGATATGNDIWGRASGTYSFEVLSSSSGFVFGNMTTCTQSKVRTSTPDKSQALAPTTTVPKARSTNADPSSVAFSTSDIFPGASAGRFQFSNISSTGIASSSRVLQSSVLSDSKDTSNKLAQPHVHFNCDPVISVFTPPFTAVSSAPEQAEPTNARPIKRSVDCGDGAVRGDTDKKKARDIKLQQARRPPAVYGAKSVSARTRFIPHPPRR